MITSVVSSHFWTLLYTASFLSTLIFIVIFCVCNPKSKRFNKHKSFILSHDLPNDKGGLVDCTNQDVSSTTFTRTNNDDMLIKHTSLNRALPDIPQTSPSSSQNNKIFNNSTININDDLDSVYTSANNPNINKNEENIQNHAYARIRNLITDSSTENDTDDYSDPTIIVKNSFSSHLINNKNLPDNNIDINSTNSYELSVHPDLLIRGDGNENVVVVEPVDIIEISNSEPKREISYNTISVREPLAKVLAERDNVEHHYNEVEDDSERVSSFYEEINSGSSVTYSKINEPLIAIKDNFEPLPSTSSYQHQQEDMHHSNMIQNESTNLPLYSFVDKKNKKTFAHHCNSDFPSNNVTAALTSLDAASNLYTKVIKPKKEPTTNTILQRYSPPPPLPPPLNKDQVHSSKRDVHHRNTIMFVGTSFLPDQNFSTTNYHSEQISHNITNSSEKDPGYETVYKEIGNDDNVNNQVDYGYEAISNDPAYEIVSAMDNGYETIKNESSDLADDPSDPNYEIISNIKAGSDVFKSNTNTCSSYSVNPSDDNVIIIEHL